jgi:hypothetical protein
MDTALQSMIDEYDERFARRRRQRYGLRGWLVSWYRQPGGRWLARLSCPDQPDTVERLGRTRCEAINRADAALRHVLRAP